MRVTCLLKIGSMAMLDHIIQNDMFNQPHDSYLSIQHKVEFYQPPVSMAAPVQVNGVKELVLVPHPSATRRAGAPECWRQMGFPLRVGGITYVRTQATMQMKNATFTQQAKERKRVRYSMCGCSPLRLNGSRGNDEAPGKTRARLGPIK